MQPFIRHLHSAEAICASHKGRMPLTAASGNVRYASDPLWRREVTAPLSPHGLGAFL